MNSAHPLESRSTSIAVRRISLFGSVFGPDEALARSAHALRPLLDASESARAGRFATRRLTNRFIVSHGVKRLALGRALARDPACLRFETAAAGKPSLASPRTEDAVSFNLSHSAQGVLVALGAGTEVGVDVEEKRTIVDLDALASAAMTPAERTLIVAAASDEERSLAFLRLWTRKEALLKGIGRGLGGTALDAFEALDASEAAAGRLGSIGTVRQADGSLWTFEQFEDEVLEGHVGVVAVPARTTEGC